MIANVTSIPDEPLSEALKKVERLFAVRGIATRKVDQQGVMEYYRQSDRSYRRYHSPSGALHIGLVTGNTPPDGQHGHRRHAELFAAEFELIGGRNCIEFGCGNGYNLLQLASSHAQTSFVGVDLSESHIASASTDARELANLRFEVGDYENLPFCDGAFDAVLAVETLCQTPDQSKALAEAFRLLRPGGRLVVIDCFRRLPLEEFDSELALAAALVEKTAAVDHFAVLPDWLELAKRIGFSQVTVVDRSNETSHDLERLYRLSRRFFKMSIAVRVAKKVMPPLAVENTICGLLMPYTVGHDVHVYCEAVLEKPQSAC